MSWADHAIKVLKQGMQVEIRPRGSSMHPRVKDGAFVTLRPIDPPFDTILPEDVVLVKVRGRVYLHLVKSVKVTGDRRQYLIGNNKGGINGWVSLSAIYGKAVRIE